MRKILYFKTDEKRVKLLLHKIKGGITVDRGKKFG